MKIELVHKDSSCYDSLQDFVTRQGLLFSTAAWIRNYPEQNIRHCAILNNNNEVIGSFIYYEFRKSIFNFIITPPYAPGIDLFCINPGESVVGRHSFDKELMTELAAYFEGLGAHYINLNLPYHCTDTQPFTWAGYTARARYTYLIDLSLSKEQLWDNLASGKRKSVNKAGKDALVVTETTDYELVYSLILKSLERNDKNRNETILKQILFSFSHPGNAFAFVAHSGNTPIGASYCAISGNKALYLFGGFDSENKHHGAGVSCMWQSILKAKEMNLRYFDFEGSMNIAIERYFREFGGRLQPYFCVEKIRPLLNVLLYLKGNKPV